MIFCAFFIQMFLGFVKFFVVSVGGLLIGIVIGLISSIVTKYTKTVKGKHVILRDILVIVDHIPLLTNCTTLHGIMPKLVKILAINTIFVSLTQGDQYLFAQLL